MIPHPKKSWTTSEIAKELGVPLQAIYRHLQWLREVGFLTEDFPGKAEDPKKVRLWHYDLNKAWAGVENRARISLETYREIVDNLNKKLKESKNEVPNDMINVGKEENFEIKLREVKREEEATYESDLGILEGVLDCYLITIILTMNQCHTKLLMNVSYKDLIGHGLLKK